MKRLAAQKAVVVVEVVVNPVEVQIPAVAIPVETRDMQVAVGIAQNYAMCLPSHHPLNTLRVEYNSEKLSP